MMKVMCRLALLFLCWPFAAWAHEDSSSSLRLKLTPAAPLEIGKPVNIVASIHFADGKPVKLDDLKEVHTRKIHLLIIDPTFSDYQHIHPQAGAKAGEYVFSFTPQKSNYRVWADLTLAKSGKHEYVQADMGKPDKVKAVIDKTPNAIAIEKGYRFDLSWDKEPVAGKASMATVVVTKDNMPVKQLQPVMAAFAHVVGFAEDFHTITHVHPMGDEPKDDKQRGGPTLTFHFEPKEKGYVRLFVQTRIDGQDLFAPFGIDVH